MQLEMLRQREHPISFQGEEKGHAGGSGTALSLRAAQAAGRHRSNAWEMLREKYFQARVLYPDRLSIQNEDGMKIFLDM